MGSGRNALALWGVAAAIPLLGCSLTVAAVGEGGVVNSPNAAAGVRLEGVAHLPDQAGDGLAFGLRIDHFAQIAPGVTYDRSRYEAMVGWAFVPRGFHRPIGYEVFARLGGARGAMGAAESTPLALTGGLTGGLPIRISGSLFGEDEILRFTFIFVPQLDVGFAGPVEGASWQLQFGGSLGIRVHLDSTLLP